MIYLFTVACPERSSEAWWVRLLETERSTCFHGLTSLLEPVATHPARFAWLEQLAQGADFETAQRLGILRGFPGYFERLWERSRVDGVYHIGNADHSVQALLPGLWLLWPDMRFVFCYRDGIGSVDAAVRSGGAFEVSARAWASDVGQLRSQQRWLAAHGADLRETRLEQLVAQRSELRRLWTWLVGDWERDAARCRPLLRELASTLEPPRSIWRRWTVGQRELFRAICGDTQSELGYPLPRSAPAWRRRSARVDGGG